MFSKIAKTKMYITVATIALSMAVASMIVFYSCRKDNNESTYSNSIYKKSVVQVVPDSVDENVILVHNLIVEFLLKSKEAYDNNPETFVNICQSGDVNAFISIIGVSNEEFEQRNEQLLFYAEQVASQNTSQNGTVSECTSCTLNQMPDLINQLNFGANTSNGDVYMQTGGSFDLPALILCLQACVEACGGPYFWLCYPICTAACYYLSTGAVVAPIIRVTEMPSTYTNELIEIVP
jgi:hypothetical protein